MSAPAHFAQLAAEFLAERLAGGDSPQAAGVAEPRPGAAPSASQGPGQGLAALARGLVEAVLELQGSEISPEQLGELVQREVGRALAEHPGPTGALASRVLSQARFLLDLPRLAELAGQTANLPPAAPAGGGPELVVGPALNFRRLLKDLDRVAASEFSVLLYGESGTGKEMLARRLHQKSPRKSGPFIAVNCAAITASLLESQLFGHKRGAFSGAERDHPGLVAAAHRGTLFLDEIGESSPEFQSKLLRVLEEKAVLPVGEVKPRPVDFRLICASHCDLSAAAEQGRFNQSLLYRVKVVPFNLPPLRERIEDLPLLARHFLERACRLAGRELSLSPAVLESLCAYRWPGNLRQLSNVITAMAAKAGGPEIVPADLPPELAEPAAASEDAPEQWLAALARTHGVPKARHQGLARLLAGSAGRDLSNQQIRQALACSDSTAKNLMKALDRAGLVRSHGQKGGRRYLVIPLH